MPVKKKYKKEKGVPKPELKVSIECLSGTPHKKPQLILSQFWYALSIYY